MGSVSESARAASPRAGKQELVYTVLRDGILDGTYGPGSRLVIDAIARELGVSPMPVREAIRRLEAEGWVVYERNQGAHVARVDAQSWIEAMTTLAVLEGYATALSADHLQPEDYARLRERNLQMRDALDRFDLAKVSEQNLAFHQTIYTRCPNGYLRRELESTQHRLNTMRSTIFMFIPTRGRVSIDEHETIVSLLESHAGARRIEQVARQHKLHTVAAFERRRRSDGPDGATGGGLTAAAQ